MDDSYKDKLIEKYKDLANTQNHWGTTGSIPAGTQSNSNNEFPSLLPIAMKVASQTLGGASEAEKKEYEREFKVQKRKDKLDSVLNGTEYVEKKLEDDEGYRELLSSGLVSVKPMSLPSGSLFYIDYQYGDHFETNLDKIITSSQSQSSS